MADKRPAALVTGAGRGIGRAIALALAGAGYDIIGNDIQAGDGNSGLRETGKQVAGMGGRFVPVQADIADLEQHEDLIRRGLDSLGRIDVLVNNAGVAPLQRKDILQTEPDSYDRVFSINARGPFFLTQKVASLMLKQNRESPFQPMIVFITSISAAVSSLSRSEYCISKAALSHTAALFAHRLAGDGIPVYEIRPGIIATDMTATVKEKYDTLISQGLVPQNRWGTPEDIGRAVACLARGDLAFATGSVIEISGGMQLRRL